MKFMHITHSLLWKVSDIGKLFGDVILFFRLSFLSMLGYLFFTKLTGTIRIPKKVLCLVT